MNSLPTSLGDAVEEPKPFVPVFVVVANDVRAIDSAIQDVIDASRNLNVRFVRGHKIDRGNRVGQTERMLEQCG